MDTEWRLMHERITPNLLRVPDRGGSCTVQFINAQPSIPFRSRDVIPRAKGNTITYFNWWGEKQPWGRPHVISRPIYRDRDDEWIVIYVDSYGEDGGRREECYYKRYYGEVKHVESGPLSSLVGFPRVEITELVDQIEEERSQELEQEIEYDNAGNIIAYKWLGREIATCTGNSIYYSPTIMEWISRLNGVTIAPWLGLSAPSRAHVFWHNNELEAHELPAEDNPFGIYAMKSVYGPILEEYAQPGRTLVRLLLSGVVLESDYGFRAQHATIIEELKRL